jgi:D-alanyl-D-alanine carboxypeptidase
VDEWSESRHNAPVRRLLASISLMIVVLCAASAPALARSAWKRDLDRIAKGKAIGISVENGKRTLYSRAARKRRVPASNEKLLLSMALLDRLAPGSTLRTAALGGALDSNVLRGNLYLVGRGDPTLTTGGFIVRELPFKPTYLGRLAMKIKRAGVRRISGRVIGSKSYFRHDWWASGWKPSFPSEEVALAAALNFNGNRHKGRHISNPEKRAAEQLTKKLRSIGVRVAEHPKVGGRPPSTSDLITKVESSPLRVMLRYMNRKSANYFAEVFGKLLAVARSGTPGSIAKGARAIEAFASHHGVKVTAYDSSGLSYSNRVSPKGLTRLLGFSEKQEWGMVLRSTLPRGGQGTLEDRLLGVPIRAKTGTLDSISALSGWIRLRRTGTRAEFSIMSRGMPKYRAVQIEDRIVRLLHKRAR